MSHWLNNVNSLLTKLDDQVETVVEERAFAQGDSSCEAIGAASTGIDDILAKRGLSSIDSKDERGEDLGQTKVEKKKVEEDDKQYLKNENSEKKAEKVRIFSGTAVKYKNADTNKIIAQKFKNHDVNSTAQKDAKRKELNELKTNSSTFEEQQLLIQQDPRAIFLKSHDLGKSVVSDLERSDKLLGKVTPNTGSERNPIEKDETNASPKLSVLPKLQDESMPSAPPSPPQMAISTTTVEPTVSASSSLSFGKEQKRRSHTVHSPDRSRKDIRELAMERKEAQKEARTLRRHIVSLNDQLEAAESELQAQRKELERAAERMEKDRFRHREEKDVSENRNAKEISLLKTQHEKGMKTQHVRFEEQLERYRKKLSDEEQRRKQEGGDLNKEMSNAIDREHDIRQTLNLLEDEKAVLLSQISTLQGQQTALGSRLESLSQAADNAMDRERDAENRLDLALNQHARQIGHRQARELQLERTIQGLNAALVLSRGNGRLTGNNTSDCEGSSNEPLRGKSHFEAQLSALESDLQTANSHLAIEKERSETLHMQLRSFSNETTQEATIVHAKEIEYNRRISDMSITISKLESKVGRNEKVSANNSNTPIDSVNDQQTPHHTKMLSEEVLRLRDKISNHNSECLAMKNRLKAAVDRSKKLDEELQIAKFSPKSTAIIPDSLVQGHKAASDGRRRYVRATPSGSIRTAMLLNSSQGDKAEQIGQVVDQIDSFAASTGKYLRRNPLARAGFIFYLVLIHLWTFVLLFFHAHSFDTAAGRDFSGSVGYSHGVHAIIQQAHINNKNEVTTDAEQSP